MTVIEIAKYRPQHLGPEPWGKRLSRAREAAGFTVRSAAEAIGQFSHGTVARLESLEHVPTARAARQRSILLIVLYGFDPADFDLGDDDVPPIIDLHAVRELGRSSTIW